MRIAVIGAGNVGVTLGKIWISKGYEVTFGVRDPESEKSVTLGRELAGRAAIRKVEIAARDANVLVLAVPWAAVADTAKAVGDVAGKVLVDCTNPIGAGLTLAVDAKASGGEEVARVFAGAKVVKAFNTTGFEVMANPVFSNSRACMLYAGDDPDAKEIVRRLVADIGFDPVDAGPLKMAADLEHFAMLWIRMAMVHGHSRRFAFGIMQR